MDVNSEQPPPTGEQEPKPLAATVYITLQPAMARPVGKEGRYSKVFPRTALLALGWSQVVLGLLSVMSQVGIFWAHTGYGMICAGFWSGIVFIVSGTITVFAARRPSRCHIVTCMIVSILSALICLVLLIISLFGMTLFSNSHYGPKDNQKSVALGFTVLQAFISVAQAILAIVTSGCSCRATCCYPVAQTGPVLYASATGAPTPLPVGSTPANVIAVPLSSSLQVQPPERQHVVGGASDHDSVDGGGLPPSYGAAMSKPGFNLGAGYQRLH